MRKKLVAATFVAVLCAACGSGGDYEAPDREDPCEAAGICDLIGTYESLRCEDAAWTYVRRRQGALLMIQCHGLGDLPDERPGQLLRRYIPFRADESETASLYDEPHWWPNAPCGFTTNVYSADYLGQLTPKAESVDVAFEMHDDRVSVVTSSTDSHSGGEFIFPEESCIRQGPTDER